jgi:hypothetical protein
MRTVSTQLAASVTIIRQFVLLVNTLSTVVVSSISLLITHLIRVPTSMAISLKASAITIQVCAALLYTQSIASAIAIETLI